MTAHLRSERGITILETTVILSVLFILAGAMSPIVSESVNTARAVKAENDASMIAMGLINFRRIWARTRSTSAAPRWPLRSPACRTCWRVKEARLRPRMRQPAKRLPTPMVPLLAAPGQAASP